MAQTTPAVEQYQELVKALKEIVELSVNLAQPNPVAWVMGAIAEDALSMRILSALHPVDHAFAEAIAGCLLPISEVRADRRHR